MYVEQKAKHSISPPQHVTSPVIPKQSNSTHPLSSLPKISYYDGSSDFHALLPKFEIIAGCCNWDDDIELLQLVGALTGKALGAFAWLKADIKGIYDQSREHLLTMFGKTKDPIISRSELSSIRQRVNPLKNLGSECVS